MSDKSVFEFGTTDYPPVDKVEKDYSYARGRLIGTLEEGAPDPGTGDWRVRYFDWDGTLLKTQFVDNGESATPPADPTYDDLTFQEWNQSSTNITRDRDIGATVITTDGKTHAHVRITPATGLDLTLYMSKAGTTGETLTVEWGDGSADSTFTATGNFNTGAHTFPEYGDYIIKISIDAPGTYGFGNGGLTGGFAGGNTQVQRDMLIQLLVGGNVTSIGNWAFYNCYSMVSISIPDSVTSIGNWAFYNCYSMVSISIPDGDTSIGTDAFRQCFSLASISIPDSVTSISGTAFYNCYSLTSISIPDGITSISNYAFAYCYSLPSISIPDSVTSIGTDAIRNCLSLASISIPDGVTSVGNNAFRSLWAMQEYIVNRTTPPTLGTTAFTDNTASTIIYVPDASTLAYRAATNWVTWADYIHPMSNRAGLGVILFSEDGGSVVAPITGTPGAVASKPVDPTKADHTFDGWYKDAGLTTAWNWATDVFPKTNVTLFAKWIAD